MTKTLDNTRLEELIALIDAEGQWNVLAIDGPCAGGKSTVAEALAEHYGAELIQMDDFFLPKEKRTEARFAEPGGNVDYERFKEDVILAYQARVFPFTYEVFDCKTMDFSGEKEVSGPKLIVEGSYAMHPYFDNWYDISLYLDVAKDVQKDRLLAREGDEKCKVYEDRWIPLEEKYFKQHNIKFEADLIFKI